MGTQRVLVIVRNCEANNPCRVDLPGSFVGSFNTAVVGDLKVVCRIDNRNGNWAIVNPFSGLCEAPRFDTGCPVGDLA